MHVVPCVGSSNQRIEMGMCGLIVHLCKCTTSVNYFMTAGDEHAEATCIVRQEDACSDIVGLVH